MRKLVLCCFLLTAISCSEPPLMSMPQEKFLDVMADMLYAEAAINRVNRVNADSIQDLYYKQIYTIHGVDSAEFAENLQIVSQNPPLSLEIYKILEERLEAKQKKDKKKEKPKDTPKGKETKKN